jgi:hypothetical protein
VPRSHRHVLLVEGHDDLHCVVGLMQHHVDWPDGKDNAPVFIEACGSPEEFLTEALLGAQLKSPKLECLGVMVDADGDPARRYGQLVRACRSTFPDLPTELSAGGVIVEANGKRFGAWIMPDNSSEGGLERFLRRLVPSSREPLWQFAVDSTVQAAGHGAQLRPTHQEKAHLYTWLAWQDPPGRQPGLALSQRSLDPRCDGVAAFVRWFRDLYRL